MLKRVLERYIPIVTVISGATVGALAAGADLIGTVGNASGTGVLLSVGIMIRLQAEVEGALGQSFDQLKVAASLDPRGNASLLFQRTEHSWHGVRPLQCPKGKLRRLFIVTVNVPSFQVWWRKVRGNGFGRVPVEGGLRAASQQVSESASQRVSGPTQRQKESRVR